MTALLEEVYTEKKEERMKKTQYGYVMGIEKKSIIIRPELHAPEVDEYDEVPRKNITNKEIAIGSYVEYTL